MASVTTSIGQGLRIANIGFRIASSVNGAVNTLQTTVDLYNLFLGGGLKQIRHAVKHAFRAWQPIPTNSGTQRLLTDRFWNDALNVLSRNSAKIVSRVTSQHGASIVRRFANPGKRFTWLIYMPTPDDGSRSPADRAIPNPKFRIPFPGLRIANKPVALQFGGGGGSNRGRVFGLGVANIQKGVPTNQFFRMDYHVPHGRGRGDAYYWQSHGSTQRFHYHVPN